jgi:NAD(P)-dependent dehydrogenase (short-subunit alcohol dehydrogenase family)
VVVANAGVQLFGQDAKIADLDLAVWQRTVDVNLSGTMLTVKHAVRAMLASGGGSIILTGSPTGLTGEGNDFTLLLDHQGRDPRPDPHGRRRLRGRRHPRERRRPRLHRDPAGHDDL